MYVLERVEGALTPSHSTPFALYTPSGVPWGQGATPFVLYTPSGVPWGQGATPFGAPEGVRAAHTQGAPEGVPEGVRAGALKRVESEARRRAAPSGIRVDTGGVERISIRDGAG